MHNNNVILLLFFLLNLSISTNSIPNDKKGDSILFNNKTNVLSNSSVLNSSLIFNNTQLSPFQLLFYALIIIFLCLFGGLVSCISLSYLSNDELVNELRSISGSDGEKKSAEIISPILIKRHWLTATICLLETTCIVYIPLFLSTITTQKISALISIFLIISFNTILPQTLINLTNQLIFAEKFLNITQALMYITSPISFFLGKLLSILIGERHRYRLFNADLKALIEMHKINHIKELAETESINEMSRKHSNKRSHLSSNSLSSFELNTKRSSNNRNIGLIDEEANLMISALEIRDKAVSELMIPIESTFMIDYDENLDKMKLKKIVDKGYSRIPVYSNHNKQDILGLVRIKQLITVDINKDKSLRELGIRLRTPLVIHPNCSLIDLLREFRKGKSHMAFITEQVEKLQKKFGLSRTNSVMKNLNCLNKNKNKEVKILGIITLEDVIERMINLEIYDEEDYEKMMEKIGANKKNTMNRNLMKGKEVIVDEGEIESSGAYDLNNKQSIKDNLLHTPDSYGESLYKQMG